jgi:hypothetical protein
MGFASGPVTIQRFTISGRHVTALDDKFVAAVKNRAFGYAPPQADDTQIGWLAPRHLFDTDITAETIGFGRFAWLALRVDTLKVPAGVVRAYMRIEEETAMAAKGREFLSRGERKLAKEAALERAAQEARGGAFRRMASYPVLIDFEQRTVLLGSLSQTVADKLMKLFSETFDVPLDRVCPETLSEQIAARANSSRALEGLAPFTLVEPPDALGEDAGLIATDMSFLGKEFLTWLWYQTDAGEQLRLNSSDIAVMIDKTLRLKCDFGLTGTDVITNDAPASSPEARAALAIGKQPNKLGLLLGAPAGEFRLTIDGPEVGISGLVVPEEPEAASKKKGGGGAEGRARLEARFEAIADAGNLLDGLFELFILRRIAKSWSRDLGALSAWAAGQREPRRRAASA